MKKSPHIIGLILIGAFFIPSQTRAQSAVLITAQDSHEASSTTAWNASEQGVGTGLIGTVTTIQWTVFGSVSSAGNAGENMGLYECDDAAYATCTLVGQTQQDVNHFDTGDSFVPFSAQMVASYPLISDKYYKIKPVSTSGITLTGVLKMAGTTGTPVYTHGTGQLVIVGVGLTAQQYDVIGEFGSNGLTIGAATSSSIFSGNDATTSLGYLDNQCSQLGNIFASGLCTGFAFLFVPSPSVMNQFFGIPTAVETKFPFSWVVQLSGIVNGLTASSTSTSTIATLDLYSAGIGSTTAIGNILPHAQEIFGYTVITSLLPAGMWATIQQLIAAAAWVILAWYIWDRIRTRHAHV